MGARRAPALRAVHPGGSAAAIRVLLVNAHGADPGYGGAERRVRYLAQGLGARGHEVSVLSAFPQRGRPEVATNVLHGSDWRESELRRLANHVGDVASFAWPRFERVLRAASPDLVHTHNLSGIGTGIWETARRHGIAVVHSILDYYLLCPRTSLMRPDGSPCRPHPLLCGIRTRRLARWNRAVSAVLGTSRHVLAAHRGLFPEAFSCTMPPPLMPLEGSAPIPARDLPETLGYMGSLAPEKGVGILLESAAALARQGLTLRIAGDGPLRDEVEVAENVDYVGHLEGKELADFVASCDVGVVPSLWEEPGGGPFVIGEWLGGGRPVLVTSRGGLVEAARDGGVIIFEATSAGLLAAAAPLRTSDRWRELCATIPAIDGEARLENWLAGHEAAYAQARAGPRPAKR